MGPPADYEVPFPVDRLPKAGTPGVHATVCFDYKCGHLLPVGPTTRNIVVLLSE
jgi:hypothetical protein